MLFTVEMNVLFLYVHTGLIWVANSLPEAYLNGVYKPQVSLWNYSQGGDQLMHGLTFLLCPPPDIFPTLYLKY